MRTHYDELGVPRESTLDEIRAAFKRRALAVHPDKGGSKEAFHRVMAAFETLSDAALRQRYDQRLTGRGGFHEAAVPHKERNRRTSGAKRHRAAEQPEEPQQASTSGQADVDAGPEPSTSASCDKPSRTEEGSAAAPRGPIPPPSVTAAAPKPSKPGSAPEKPSAPPTAASSSPPPGHAAAGVGAVPLELEKLLGRLLEVMQKLSAVKRRWVIQSWLTQPQRLELESVALARRAQRTSRPTCLSTRAPGDSLETDSASTDSDAEESGGHSDMALMSPGYGEACFAIEDLAEERADSEDEEVQPQLAICDQDEEEPSLGTVGEKPRGCKSVRGLFSRRRALAGGSYSNYNAGICIGAVEVTTKATRDLPQALDWLLVLSEIKQQVKGRAEHEAFSAAMRRAFAETLGKYDLTVESLGLTFNMHISKKFWIGTLLVTPAVHDLEIALGIADRLLPYQGRSGVQATVLLARRGMQSMEADWQAFKEDFLDICAAAGQCRQILAARLLEKEEAHRSSREAREAKAELWKGRRIALEERKLECWNLRRMVTEERQQRHFHREERRRERACSSAMASEDRRSRAAFRRESALEDRLLRKVRRLLGRWERRVARRMDAQRRARLRAAARRRAADARERLAMARAAAAERRARERDERAAREARWRSMSRRDLTMEEMLGQRV